MFPDIEWSDFRSPFSPILTINLPFSILNDNITDLWCSWSKFLSGGSKSELRILNIIPIPKVLKLGFQMVWIWNDLTDV